MQTTPTPTPPPSGERWNVNMPAVIGIVFVFLVGVVIWVISSGGGDDDPPSSGATAGSTSVLGTTGASPAPVTTVPVTTVPVTTSPVSLSPTPLPSTVPPTSTDAPTSPSTDAPPPVTTAPGADAGAVPGDLAVPGRPMQRPPCDGSFITVLASPIGDQATAGGVAAVLEQYPGSNYLRTDQTCPSLTPDSGGEPIYVIYLGPFAFASDACEARAAGPEGAYARELSDELGPDHSVACT